jgi:hypothetical protein
MITTYPATQFVHTDAPDADNMPTAQSVQTLLVGAPNIVEYFPAVHAAQSAKASLPVVVR